MDLNDYIPALRYGAKIPQDANDIQLTENYVLVGDSSTNATGVALSGDARMASTGSMTLNYTGTLVQGLPFIASSSSFGSAEWNTGTGWISVLSSAIVGGRTPYVTGYTIRNTGDIDCAGGSSLIIETIDGAKIWEVAAAGMSQQSTVTAAGTLYSVLHSPFTCAGTAGLPVGIHPSTGSLTGTPTLKVTIWGILK